MAQGRDDPDLGWYDPPLRGVLPIAQLHVPRRLQKTLRQQRYTVTFDRDFRGVMQGCADARPDTWISGKIIDLYTAVHERGYAHSAEVWDGATLVGGTYGIALGGAFFGESMFSRATDASKIALVHLAARLWRRGYTLFDTQFVNDHLLQFGCTEIPRREYHWRLATALDQNVTFYSEDSVSTGKASVEVSSSEGAGLFSSPCLLSEAGDSFTGSFSGAVSAEKFSDFAAVELFLQSISQTS